MNGKAFGTAANGRRRSEQMLLRLTPEEREEIASKAREAGMTQADFVLEAVRGTRERERVRTPGRSERRRGGFGR